MRPLLALIMRGRTHAMTAAAVTAVLSLMLPPLMYVSGAVVCLATLKQGPREGALVVAGTVLLSGAFSFLLVGSPAPALALLSVCWLPAWLLSCLLGATRSQGAVLLAAGAMGALAVLVMHLLLGGEPDPWWREALRRFFEPALAGTGAQAAAALDDLLNVWAPRMTRYLGAAITAGVMLSLVLGRWGHALLDNPGGFGQEFRALRVGRQALIGCLVVAAVAFLGAGVPGRLAADLMGPVATVLLFQGLAVAHGVIRARRAPTGWLVAMYLLLAVPPHVALPALTVAGLLDGWMDFRARARRRDEDSNDADHSS